LAIFPATEFIARVGRGYRYEELPEDVVVRARQCLLDWIGVTIAGHDEPLVRLLRDEVAEQGGHQQATLIGSGGRVATQQAALVNGAASHALDFDDVQWDMPGHPSVPVLPGLLALAEQRGASGRDVLTAFVAGVETECRVGAALGPGHYARGWHATATMGTLGAAAACAHLLGLEEEPWRHALGIAATQASGSKSMFGTMCKPFHAGHASASGLLAASLAGRGFTSHPEAIETAQGLGATQTDTFEPERLADWGPERYALRDVLFKYHAACYGTHATIEGALRLRAAHDLGAGDVEAVHLRVPPSLLGMCNIQAPQTALEGKFSLRFTAALALGTGETTEAAFTDTAVREPELVALRDRVTVEPDEAMPAGETLVTVAASDGRRLEARVNMHVPEADLDLQQEKLEAKFRALVTPILGDAKAEEIIGQVRQAEQLESPKRLLELCVA
jgi:2-methylcitrate dehydratase PrpD